jgi:hypothetical protein
MMKMKEQGRKWNYTDLKLVGQRKPAPAKCRVMVKVKLSL